MDSQTIAEIYQQHSQRVFATLVRLTGDFDLAEECLQEAFAAALLQWPESGIPDNPTAWLISTGKFKAIDAIRRQTKLRDMHPEIVARIDRIQFENAATSQQDVPDDRLRLIFTCCHPAIDPKIQVPLTLREVCGLTTEEIARAYLTAPTTMAQRIVRGKSKIRDARIPYEIPTASDLPERLHAVLSVIYLVFTEGYSASSGEEVTRVDLSDEAIRLGRLLLKLLPDPEVMGLLALMLLHESRRQARTTSNGDIVLLEDQDRTLWDRQKIEEGKRLVERSLLSRQFGCYTIQAAISAVHADASEFNKTDWNQIIALYSLLKQLEPSPIIELNQAVAIAMRDGPQAGLRIIESIAQSGELEDYHLFHSAKGELHRRAGNATAARESLSRALELAKQQPERRLLQQKLESLVERN